MRRITSRRGVPVVIDFVGAPYMTENLMSPAPQGSIVVVGTLGGPQGHRGPGRPHADAGAHRRDRAPPSPHPTIHPTISVAAILPGASPETMASAVATPLEKEFSTIAGIDSMSSSQLARARTQITLQFALNRNIDAAAQDVQAAIARAVRRLPSDMPTPPSYRKVNPADQPDPVPGPDQPDLPMSDAGRVRPDA